MSTRVSNYGVAAYIETHHNLGESQLYPDEVAELVREARQRLSEGETWEAVRNWIDSEFERFAYPYGRTND